MKDCCTCYTHYQDHMHCHDCVKMSLISLMILQFKHALSDMTDKLRKVMKYL